MTPYFSHYRWINKVLKRTTGLGGYGTLTEPIALHKESNAYEPSSVRIGDKELYHTLTASNRRSRIGKTTNDERMLSSRECQPPRIGKSEEEVSGHGRVR